MREPNRGEAPPPAGRPDPAGGPRRPTHDWDPMRRWETLIERQIREAAAEGKFDDLPHQGTRLPLLDDSAAGDWAIAYRMLKDAGAAPPWIEADKAVRELLARQAALVEAAPRVSSLGWDRARAAYAELLDELDRAIARLNVEAPTPRQHRRPIDRYAELAAYDARRTRR
jgi:hypothetical protein